MAFQLFNVSTNFGNNLASGIQSLGEGVNKAAEVGEQYRTDAKAMQALEKTHPELTKALGYDSLHTSPYQAHQLFQGAVKAIGQQKEMAAAQENQARASYFQSIGNSTDFSTQVERARFATPQKGSSNPLLDDKDVSDSDKQAARAEQDNTANQDSYFKGKAAVFGEMTPQRVNQLIQDREAYKKLRQQYAATNPSADTAFNAQNKGLNANPMQVGLGSVPNGISNALTSTSSLIANWQMQKQLEAAKAQRPQIASTMKDLQSKYSNAKDLLTMPDDQFKMIPQYLQQAVQGQQSDMNQKVLDAVRGFSSRGGVQFDPKLMEAQNQASYQAQQPVK